MRTFRMTPETETPVHLERTIQHTVKKAKRPYVRELDKIHAQIGQDLLDKRTSQNPEGIKPADTYALLLGNIGNVVWLRQHRSTHPPLEVARTIGMTLFTQAAEARLPIIDQAYALAIGRLAQGRNRAGHQAISQVAREAGPLSARLNHSDSPYGTAKWFVGALEMLQTVDYQPDAASNPVATEKLLDKAIVLTVNKTLMMETMAFNESVRHVEIHAGL